MIQSIVIVANTVYISVRNSLNIIHYHGDLKAHDSAAEKMNLYFQKKELMRYSQVFPESNPSSRRERALRAGKIQVHVSLHVS